jgi:ABC-type glycerol-3-phosphate transport system substrate-binding protein
MKKTVSKTALYLASIAIILSLPGCVNGDSSQTQSGGNDSYSLSPIEQLQELNHFAVYDRTIYFDSYESDSCMVKKYEDGAVSTVMELDNNTSTITWMEADEKGIWIYENWDTEPDKATSGQWLKLYSPQGEPCFAVSLDKLADRAEQAATFFVVAGGYACINFKNVLCVFDATGELVGEIKTDGLLNLSATWTGKELVVSYATTTENYCVSANLPSLTLSSPYALDISSELLFGGYLGLGGFAYNEDGIYSLQNDSGKTSPVLLWTQCGISFKNLPILYAFGPEDFLYFDRDDTFTKAYLLSKNDDGASKAKTILTLETFFGNAMLSQYVLAFNEQSSEYSIKIIDLSEQYSNTEDSIQYLNTRLITGTGPDMICFGGIPAAAYGQNGYLLDLYELIDNDSDVSRDDYLLLDTFENDGRLYTLAPGFDIQTYLGREDEFGERFGWTFDEYFEMERGLSSTQSMLGSPTKEGFLEASIFGCMDLLIDWEKNTCDFDNEMFRKILSSANKIATSRPADSETTGQVDGSESVNESIALGTQKLMPIMLMNIYDFAKAEAETGCNLFPIGWPSSDGSCGSFIENSTEIGITVSSACPEGCWEFLKYITTDESFYDYTSFIPISKAAFEWQIYSLQHPLNEIDPEKVVLGEDGGFYVDGVFYDMEYDTTPLITDRQAEIICELIEHIDSVNQYNTTITQMILEEATMYFAGNHTLDEAINSIQSRVSLYLSEQT